MSGHSTQDPHGQQMRRHGGRGSEHSTSTTTAPSGPARDYYAEGGDGEPYRYHSVGAELQYGPPYPPHALHAASPQNPVNPFLRQTDGWPPRPHNVYDGLPQVPLCERCGAVSYEAECPCYKGPPPAPLSTVPWDGDHGGGTVHNTTVNNYYGAQQGSGCMPVTRIVKDAGTQTDGEVKDAGTQTDGEVKDVGTQTD